MSISAKGLAGLALIVAAGCASNRLPGDGTELLARSVFRAEIFDGRCPTSAARREERLTDYVSRIGIAQLADLDCVMHALPDAVPLADQPPAYYYYQTYLLIRAKNGNLDGDTLESLFAQTGLLNAPLSGQTLYAIGALFGVKSFDACNRDLAEQATKIGGLKFADEVNAAQRAIGEGEPQTCTHPVALDIIRRAADVPTEIPDTAEPRSLRRSGG